MAYDRLATIGSPQSCHTRTCQANGLVPPVSSRGASGSHESERGRGESESEGQFLLGGAFRLSESESDAQFIMMVLAVARQHLAVRNPGLNRRRELSPEPKLHMALSQLPSKTHTGVDNAGRADRSRAERAACVARSLQNFDSRPKAHASEAPSMGGASRAEARGQWQRATANLNGSLLLPVPVAPGRGPWRRPSAGKPAGWHRHDLDSKQAGSGQVTLERPRAPIVLIARAPP